MSYLYTAYDNFKELRKYDPKLAKEMLKQVDKGEWMSGQIIVYPDKEEFAKYELTEGWYIDNHFDRVDYNGAPNPIDYIDMEAFGSALLRQGDESVEMEMSDGRVVTTSYGW